ncbi:hypothetical protein OC835_006836 [Tilletia horrida]|nr:hypothetical protein OC835_006836 [Tilletia horrida]
MASLQLQDIVAELACFKLYYDSDHSALLCGTCRSAVDTKRLKQHFQKQANQNAFFIPLPGDAGVQEARAYIGTDISAHWGRLRQLIAPLPAVLPPFQLASLPADGPPHRYLQQKTAWLCSCDHIEVISRNKTDHLRAHPGHAFRPSTVQSWTEKGNWFPVAMAGPMPGQSHLAPGAEPTDPTGAVLLRMVEKKAAAANLDPVSLVPEWPTPPEFSKTLSPWLRKVRWSVLAAELALPWTKTTTAAGLKKSITGVGGALDPLAALRHHRRLSPAAHHEESDTHLFAYRVERQGAPAVLLPLPKDKMLAVFNNALAAAGLEAFTGHSFRIGRATAHWHAGASLDEVKLIGGWKSDCVVLYLRDCALGLLEANRRTADAVLAAPV